MSKQVTKWASTFWFWLALGGVALAANLVDQGAPGTQGPWKVTSTGGAVSITFDGGFIGTTAPYPCNVASPNKVTNVLAASLATPSAAQAGRKWMSVCNSVQNVATRIVKCRADNTAPVFALGNPGDVLSVGDCVTYTIASTQNVLCIANTGAGTDVQTYECF
jgi:hypothetical protein